MFRHALVQLFGARAGLEKRRIEDLLLELPVNLERQANVRDQGSLSARRQPSAIAAKCCENVRVIEADHRRNTGRHSLGDARRGRAERVGGLVHLAFDGETPLQRIQSLIHLVPG